MEFLWAKFSLKHFDINKNGVFINKSVDKKINALEISSRFTLSAIALDGSILFKYFFKQQLKVCNNDKNTKKF